MPKAGQVTSLQATVLVGEYNYGRFPLGANWPRAIVPVLNRPHLWHLLGQLSRAGFGRVAVCANGSTERIREELRGTTPPDMELIWVEGSTPRGAAGCVRDSLVHLDPDRPVFVVEGSLYLGDKADLQQPTQQMSGIKVFYGHQGGAAIGGGGPAEPAGMYWIWPDVMPFIPARGYCDLKQQLLPALRGAGIEVRMHAVGSLRPRISTVASYLDLNYSLMVESETDPAVLEAVGAVRLEGTDAWAMGNCRIDPSAQVVGPVLLGSGVRIEAGAVVAGPTVIGDGSIVESGACVRDSVLWRRVRVGARSELTGILAVDGVEIAEGCVTSYTSFVDWHIDLPQAHAWQMAGFARAPLGLLARARSQPVWRQQAATL